MQLLVLLSGIQITEALPASLSDHDLHWRRWSTTDGLPQNTITSLLQSRDGHIWMTTFGGIARFDGVQFDVFTPGTAPELVTNRYLSSHEAKDGVLWFGAERGGLHRYELGRFSHVPLSDELDSAHIFDIAEDDTGALWLATSAGLYQRTGTGLTRYGPETGLRAREAYTIYWTEDGQLLVGTAEGVYRQDNGRFEWLTSEESIWWIHEHQGDLLLGGYETLARYHDGVLTPLDQPVSWIIAGKEDAEGRLWLPSQSGISWLSGDELIPLPLTGLHEDLSQIRAVLVDREGSLWLGTGGDGLVQVWDPHLTREDDLPAGVVSMIEDSTQTLWMASCEELISRRGDVLTTIPAPEHSCLHSLALDASGSVWVSTESMLLQWDGDWIVHYEHPDNIDIRALYFDPRGRLWLGTYGSGLFRYEDGALVAVPGLEGESVQVITSAPDGTLWVGTSWGVVKIAPDGALHRLGKDAGLPRGLVRDIHLDGDVVWLGTYGAGLIRLSQGEVTRYTTSEGLPDDVVSRILDDGQGNFWMNGNRGIFRVSKNDLREMAEGRLGWLQCATYDSGEGNGGSQPAGWRTADGHLRFPTIDSVIRIDPSDPAVVMPPSAMITRMISGRQPIAHGSHTPQGERDLEIQYTALSLIQPSVTRFQYRLKGYQDEWVEAHARRLATYTNLPPGHYTFQVRARSSAGVWSDIPAEASLTIPPHLYELLWFKILLSSGLLGTVMLLSNRRLRQVRQRNQRLQDEITARLRSERGLREREAHYRTVFERAADGFFIHNARGELLEVNPTGCRMLASSVEKLKSSAPLAFVDPDSRPTYQRLIQNALDGGEQSAEGRISWEGLSFEAQLSATPFQRDNQHHALITISDLSARREAEAQRQQLQERIQQAEKLNALGQLAGGVAHDFNNILTVITANAHIISMEGGINREIAEEIVACSDRGARLVRQLLAASRQQKLHPRELDLRALVLGMQSMFTSVLPSSIDLVLPEEGDTDGIYADPTQIERALLNLVLNARDAMASGGQLSIQLSRRTLTTEEAALWPGAGAHEYVVLAISDTGEGIDSATLSHIFEPFFTTKPTGKGTGLGLTTVHGVIQQSMGFIHVESTPAEGTTFLLHLPHHPLTPQVSTPPQPTVLKAPRQLVLLLCDDDPPVLRATVRALKVHQVEVIGAGDPEDAIRLFHQNRDRIDVLVTDVSMPKMTGPELAEALRVELPKLPVVFISGYSGKLLPEGFEDPLVEKPFRAEHLLEVIRSMLQSRASREE